MHAALSAFHVRMLKAVPGTDAAAADTALGIPLLLLLLLLLLAVTVCSTLLLLLLLLLLLAVTVCSTLLPLLLLLLLAAAESALGGTPLGLHAMA